MQILTQPGCTSLGEDLRLLASHAAPADCVYYAECQEAYQRVCCSLLTTFLLPCMTANTLSTLAKEILLCVPLHPFEMP